VVPQMTHSISRVSRQLAERLGNRVMTVLSAFVLQRTMTTEG
jgi:hypothetical protein